MSAGLFFAAAAPAGAVAAAWSAGVAARLRDPDAPALRVMVACTRCGGTRGMLLRVAGSRCRACGERPPGWVMRAQVAGAVIPVAALHVARDPVQAAALTLTGWLLLAIWIADEVSLWIPHAYWATGILVGLAARWHAGGPAAVAGRAVEMVVLVSILALAASCVRVATRVPAVGTGDYGVLSFIAAALGYQRTLDVLLLAGILALGLATVRAARPQARRGAFILATGGTAAAALFGVPGATLAGAVLAASLRRGRARARTAPLPFGAALAGAALILLTWAAPFASRPGADAGADAIRLHLPPHEP